ncbi:MAG: cysteine hydrolase [Gammaproteobacteria bacterium]|nr:cysteine hydrolase [Gammaproteobacteria bacterium]
MKRALLVIDVQNEYFTGRLPVTYPPGSFTNILQVIDTALEKAIAVIVIQHTAIDETSVLFRKHSSEWKLHADIEQRRPDVLIEKHWPDCFKDTNLEAWLRQRGIDTLTLCGYMTQNCCDTTARQAFHRGYKVEFLSDATGTLAISNPAGTVSAEELQRAILVTQVRFSHVMSTTQWLGRINGAEG